MTTTATITLDTIADLVTGFEDHSDHEGFGYIGERRSILESARTGERDADTAASLVLEADAMIVRVATERGWSVADLFTWANSKNGRWYGDCWFGANGQHAHRYL